MREIIPEKLWIGNAMDARNVSRIHDRRIRAIVDLAREEPLPRLTRDLTYCRFPIADGQGNAPELLSAAITTNILLICKQIPSLVACSAGMSRSPAIVAASLALVRGQSPDAVLRELIDGYPHDVSPPLWVDVKNAYDELLD